MPRKAELVKAIADESGISRKDATAAIEAFISYLSESAKHSQTISIPGLGKVTITSQVLPEARKSRSRDPLRIPAKKVIRFRSRKDTTDALKLFTGAYKKL